jgi:plastocyanin
MSTRRFLSLLLGIALVLTSGVPPGSRTQTSSLTTGFAPSPVEANHRVASNAPSETVSPAANQIAITDAGFYPSVLTVTLDTEVMWVNEAGGTHVLVSGEPWRLYLPVVMRDAALSAHVGASLHWQAPPGFTAELPPGGIFTYTFTAVGEYPYYLSTALQSTGRVVVQGTELPPDPESVAPPVDDTVATTMISATQFLYTGPNPIQTGVMPGTIEGRRVAVLRGKALTREGVPLSGVAVSVHDHPEYGQTLSREDGMYDLAANGGGELVLDYEKEGYLPVQRHVQVPWQDYVWLPDVALIARDPRVTTIDLTLGTMQVARGSVVSDDDGTRQATVLFPAGTEAEVILADGSTQAVMVLHVRTTEFTVGERGPEAMPGELPPTNGYTYAGEFTVDEAVAKVDGKDVLFSQPVFVYLENFLSFPTGTAIPVGTYDDERALWVPSENGCVVEILTISGGLAQLDTGGQRGGPGRDDGGARAVGGAVHCRAEPVADAHGALLIQGLQLGHGAVAGCRGAVTGGLADRVLQQPTVLGWAVRQTRCIHHPQPEPDAG